MWMHKYFRVLFFAQHLFCWDGRRQLDGSLPHTRTHNQLLIHLLWRLTEWQGMLTHLLLYCRLVWNWLCTCTEIFVLTVDANWYPISLTKWNVKNVYENLFIACSLSVTTFMISLRNFDEIKHGYPDFCMILKGEYIKQTHSNASLDERTAQFDGIYV